MNSIVNTRAKAARTLAEADTIQAYIDLLARTLTRYGDIDATHEGAAQFELICTHTEQEVPEEWRIHYRYPHRSAFQDVVRRHAWLTGTGPGLHQDDFTEAASLVCDVLCALHLAGFSDGQVHQIIDQVENRFLGKETDSDVATLPEAAVHVRVRSYTVCAVPEQVADAHHYSLFVSHNGPDTWCVQDSLGSYVEADAYRTTDPHRLDFAQAMERARTLAPHMTVNGFTVAQAIAHPDGRIPRTSCVSYRV